MIRTFCAVVLLAACVISARVIEVDVSVPNSHGEVTTTLGDTLTFSNGMIVSVREVECNYPVADYFSWDLYFAILDSTTITTYFSEDISDEDEWFKDSVYNLKENVKIPYLNISAGLEHGNQFEYTQFPELHNIDSFLLVDSIDYSYVVNRVIPGHYIGYNRRHWNGPVSELYYDENFNDMVYLQTADGNNSLRFKIKEPNSGTLKDYGESITITWEVDSAGNGIFRGFETSINVKNKILNVQPQEGTVSLYTINGRLLQSFESRTQFLKSKATLPRGVYLLKDLKSVKKISIQ